MRLRINKIGLVGTSREFFLDRNLNILTGSIFTGKTTLMKCIRGLLGSSLNKFSREARNHITNLAGEILIGDDIYEVIRPFVTTEYATVSIGGESAAERLPALRGKPDEKTYGDWLLEKFGLPSLKVPNAPTRDDSEISSLSVNDYLMYCYLRQDEIDTSVFGHTDNFKNNKRKFVFEVIYGKYDVEVAHLQLQRREIVRELRRLENHSKTVEEFISGTPFENRAVIAHNLSNTNRELETAFLDSEALAQQIRSLTNTDDLRSNLLAIQQQLDILHQKLQYEQYSQAQKQSLIAQLQTQSSRLTKSIVAGYYLLDFDFLACPRCGSTIQPSRSEPEICYLCLQQTEPQVTQEDLIKEQDRLERQISESIELVNTHGIAITDIEQSISQLEIQRHALSSEIDHRTRRYVSEQAEQIAQLEQYRTQLQERKQRLEEYLELYNRQDQATRNIEQLNSRLEELGVAINLANSRISEFETYLAFLDNTYQEILREIKVPSFVDPGLSIIDRQTYLPVFEGRRFDELESPGQIVMVNIAHALAHHLTCLHFNLKLPNILLIDGLSGNFGRQGLDLERIKAIYKCIIRISEEHQDRLQIFVSDNTVPEEARAYVFAEFSDENKLIPL